MKQHLIISLCILSSMFMSGCATSGAIDQFKAFDEKLNANIRADAQQEIANCQNYNIPEIDKKQCALCGEYVLHVMDWKDSKVARVKQLMESIKLPETIGNGRLDILSTAADIAYGDRILEDPEAELKQISSEAQELAINLRNACAPLFTRAKLDATRLGIAIGSTIMPLP